MTQPVGPRERTLEVCAKIEGFFAKGAEAVAVHAPEALDRWNGALTLVRCLRSELQAPGSSVRSVVEGLRGVAEAAAAARGNHGEGRR